MHIEDEYIRLIFGLKLKQIRTEKKLSLFGLAKLTGLSKSYLNEIEKGKKYPKTDKILVLSESLEVPYDHMVSLKLDKNLAPIGEILKSKISPKIMFLLTGARLQISSTFRFRTMSSKFVAFICSVSNKRVKIIINFIY